MLRQRQKRGTLTYVNSAASMHWRPTVLAQGPGDIHMEFVTLFAIALAGALASPLGGAAALCRRPTTLALSVAVGFAAGALLGAFAFEMLPQSARLASLPVAVAGFVAGFALLYGLDLFVHRGASAGEKAAQRQWVLSVRRRRRQRGDEVTVLAGGTGLLVIFTLSHLAR